MERLWKYRMCEGCGEITKMSGEQKDVDGKETHIYDCEECDSTTEISYYKTEPKVSASSKPIYETRQAPETPDIKFDVYPDSHAFSIRCGKCADIHNAQLEGKQDKPCECDCHDKPYRPPTYIPCPCPDPYPQPYVPYYQPTTVDPMPQPPQTWCFANGAQDLTIDTAFRNDAGYAQPYFIFDYHKGAMIDEW